MVKASIVIRCYNEEQHIGRILSGIMQQTVKDVEIILVDSGSTDATLSIAERFPVKLVYISPEEFSFGRSLNMGCSEAEGEFIVLASAHVYPVNSDWLERLIAPFEDPLVALVYGRQIGGDSTRFSEHQVFAKWFPLTSNLNQNHPFCNNANAAIRRELWEKIHYNEELTGLEDLDWAKRAMAQGFRLAYAADAEIVHLHDETPSRIYNRYRREAIAMKQIFPEENFTLGDFLRLFFGNVASDYCHALRSRVLMANLSGIFVFRLMQFWGANRGFAQRDPVTSVLKRTFYYPNSIKQPPIKSPEKDDQRRIDYSKLLKEKAIDEDL